MAGNLFFGFFLICPHQMERMNRLSTSSSVLFMLLWTEDLPMSIRTETASFIGHNFVPSNTFHFCICEMNTVHWSHFPNHWWREHNGFYLNCRSLWHFLTNTLLWIERVYPMYYTHIMHTKTIFYSRNSPCECTEFLTWLLRGVKTFFYWVRYGWCSIVVRM